MRRPRLRTILLEVGLLVFILPLAALIILRVYDTQLARQTETELIAQGTIVATLYRDAMIRLGVAADHGSPAPYKPPDADATSVVEPSHLSLWWSDVGPPAGEPESTATAADALATMAGAEITPLLVATSAVTLAGIRVVDFQGIVVASTRGEIGQSIAMREEVRRSIAGERVSLLRHRSSEMRTEPLSSASRNTGVRVFVAIPVVAHDRVVGAVILSRTPMSLGKAYYQDRYQLLGIALVLLVIVLGVTFLAAAFIVRPINSLVTQAEAVASGRLHQVKPLRDPGTLEMARLSEAVARMATVLQERSDYIRDFATSVSHEFKTPLASMHGTLELLRDHLDEMSIEQRKRFLDNLDGDVQRLAALVKRLLELARADVLRPGDETADVSDVLAHLDARLRGAGHSVTVSSRDACRVRMAPDVLDALLTSLVDNAFQHGGPGVAVEISARLGESRDTVEIRVSDNGAGIAPADAARAFEPFFTTSRDAGGTGLGLTIVRSLVRAHGGMIELESVERGVRVSVWLPAA